MNNISDNTIGPQFPPKMFEFVTNLNIQYKNNNKTCKDKNFKKGPKISERSK